jgi:hypothetical protein
MLRYDFKLDNSIYDEMTKFNSPEDAQNYLESYSFFQYGLAILGLAKEPVKFYAAMRTRFMTKERFDEFKSNHIKMYGDLESRTLDPQTSN